MERGFTGCELPSSNTSAAPVLEHCQGHPARRRCPTRLPSHDGSAPQSACDFEKMRHMSTQDARIETYKTRNPNPTGNRRHLPCARVQQILAIYDPDRPLDGIARLSRILHQNPKGQSVQGFTFIFNHSTTTSSDVSRTVRHHIVVQVIRVVSWNRKILHHISSQTQLWLYASTASATDGEFKSPVK